METRDARKVPVEAEEARRSSLNEQGIAANPPDLRDIEGPIAARLPVFWNGALGQPGPGTENVEESCSRSAMFNVFIHMGPLAVPLRDI